MKRGKKSRKRKRSSADSEPLSNYIDAEMDEASWRASFELANALGLAMVTIDEAGNINGEIIKY